MFESIGDLFLNPDRFFARRIQQPQSFREPVLVVFIVAILTGIYAMMSANITARIFSGPAAQMGGIIGAFGGVSGFIVQFVMWVVISGIFFAISMALSGNGAFTRTLEFIGLGMVPMIFASVLEVVLAMIYLPEVKVTPVSVMTDPTVVTAAVTRLMQDPAMHTLTISASIISVIFMIWAANLWIFGMKHARGLSLKNAAICVVIPVAVYIAVTMGTLLMTQGAL
jgi:hypothetical protein